MKNIFKVSIITAGIVLLFNVNSFALIDGAVWGGYEFKGIVENSSKENPQGLQYGVKGHYNTTLIPLIELGIGGYYQKTNMKLDLLSDTIVRDSAGLDINFILSLPVLHPYARGTYAIWDKLDSDTQNFKAYGLGAGLEITIFPFLRVFGEYMYENTDHDFYLKTNSINFGLKADI